METILEVSYQIQFFSGLFLRTDFEALPSRTSEELMASSCYMIVHTSGPISA